MSVLGVLCILLAVAFSVYVSNYLAEKNKSLVRAAYTKTVEELDDSVIQTMLTQAQEYNTALVPGTISMDGAFSLDALLAASEDYYELLMVNEAGIMGYVEIAKTVSDIKIIAPNDVDEILIQDGKNMLMLLTCHPYGSGGEYRLVVYCEIGI